MENMKTLNLMVDPNSHTRRKRTHGINTLVDVLGTSWCLHELGTMNRKEQDGHERCCDVCTNECGTLHGTHIKPVRYNVQAPPGRCVGDSKVAETWINGYYAMVKKVQRQDRRKTED